MSTRKRLLAVSCALLATTALAQAQFLVIPNSTDDNVWSFDAFDGSLISNNFIPDDGRLSTPKNAILSNRGTIFVADQLTDAVFEYSFDGTYLSTVADNATNGVDNARGIAVRGNTLYVTIASGTLANTVQAIDLTDGTQSTFISGPDPFDIHFRDNDVLVSDIDFDDVLSYDFSGNLIGTVVDGNDGFMDFPQQVNDSTGGNFLVAGFSPPSGVYEFDTDGLQVAYLDASGARGVYKLGNGNILFTTGSGVFSWNQNDGLVETIVDGGSFQYIELVPEPSALVLLAIGALAATRRR